MQTTLGIKEIKFENLRVSNRAMQIGVGMECSNVTGLIFFYILSAELFFFNF